MIKEILQRCEDQQKISQEKETTSWKNASEIYTIASTYLWIDGIERLVSTIFKFMLILLFFLTNGGRNFDLLSRTNLP